MQAVIMAGGRGTRIASVNSEVPKPMIEICGKPILLYQIECLKAQGITDIILVVGYLGDVIKAAFGDGSSFGVNIGYVTENEPLGTAGALYLLKDRLKQDFLLLCGDIIFDVDILRFYAAHKKCGGLATIFTHPNSHPYDSSLIVADSGGRVVKWLNKEDGRRFYKNRVNAGLHFLSPKILERFTCLKKTDLDRDVLKPLVCEGGLFVYDSPEYVKDMGTPDRYYSVAEDIKSGLVGAKNLKNKQRAIFLDRDGTLNEYVGFLRSPEDMRLCSGAAEAVKKINKKGYLAIVITNQPVIARGEVTEEGLETIHECMEAQLGREGAYLDAIYYCPHHPHGGYEGEIKELKFDCDCRKPKPGLVFRAAEDYNISLADSWFIGDSESDISCALNAGCRAAMIGKDARADIKGDSLFDCVNKIFD